MELVLSHLGADRGQFQDLVPQRARVRARQGVPAAAADPGPEDVRVVSRQERSLLELVAGLTAAPAPGGRSGRGAFDGRGIAGGRPGRVGGVLAELLLEIADALVQGSDALFVPLKDDQQGRLHSGRDLIPQFRRDRGLLLHAAGVQSRPGSVNLGP